MKHSMWIAFSGVVWGIVGALLLVQGFRLLGLSDGREGTIWWAVAGLAIGFFKGRFVLAKTAMRFSLRIESLPMPIRFFDVYSKSYFFLIGAMMAMGILLRFFPNEWRALIDIAVGFALLNGAVVYFRKATSLMIGRSRGDL